MHFLQAQKLEAMGTMVNGIAHNFNNALAVIVGNTEMVRRLSPDDPALREGLDAALTACAEAQALVRRMQTLGRPHTGERRPVRVGPIVTEATALLRATLPAAVHIALGIDPDAPTVFADPTESNSSSSTSCRMPLTLWRLLLLSRSPWDGST